MKYNIEVQLTSGTLITSPGRTEEDVQAIKDGVRTPEGWVKLPTAENQAVICFVRNIDTITITDEKA